MNDNDNNGRTHEPSLRELTAQLDDLKELLLAKHDGILKVMDERDKLYTDRAISSKTAVEAALKAAETLTNASFAASEKAIGKADANAEKWRENANEWRAAMQDREVKFAGRVEMDNEFKNLRNELMSLKESRAEGGGRHSGSAAVWGYVISAIAVLGSLFTAAIALYKMGK